MRLVFATLLITMSVSGCGELQRVFTSFTGDLTEKCFRGVTYVQSNSGLALAVDADGKPFGCK